MRVGEANAHDSLLSEVCRPTINADDRLTDGSSGRRVCEAGVLITSTTATSLMTLYKGATIDVSPFCQCCTIELQILENKTWYQSGALCRLLYLNGTGKVPKWTS